MPRPVFIVCAQYGTEDKTTGQMSLFGIVDKLVVSAVPPQPVGGIVVINFPTLYVAAKWMRNQDDDQDQMYEVTLQGIAPDGKIVVDSSYDNFKFAENRPLHIVVMILRTPLQFTSAGTLLFVGKLRRAGSDEKWLSQDYPVAIEVSAPAP